MIKINDFKGKLFGVFHDEDEAIEAINELFCVNLDPIELYETDRMSFGALLDWQGLSITEDTVNCQVCHNELDDDFDDELLIGYRCSYCRENPEMGKYKL